MPGTDDDLDPSKLGSLGGTLDDLAKDYVPSPLPAGLLSPNPGAIPPQDKPKPLPALSVLNTICLRGPCRLLMQSTSVVEDAITSGPEPISTDRYCLNVPGVLMEVKEPTYECSHWDPLPKQMDAATKAREKRRRAFLDSEQGVECQRADAERIQKRLDQLAAIDAEHAERQRERDIAIAKKAAAVEAGDFDPQE